MTSKNRLGSAWLWLALLAILFAACSPSANQTTTSTAQDMQQSTLSANVPQTGQGEFDELFINMMVPHHQGAVEMAKIALQRAEHPEVKEMANAIIAGQEDEITRMKDWKQEWYGSSSTPSMSEMPSLEEMPGMGGMGHAMDMQAEVDRLKAAAEPFDLAFIDAMIPHHKSAIDAANLALNQAVHPEIKELAQAILTAQKKEIDQMNSWRAEWYPDAAPAGSTH